MDTLRKNTGALEAGMSIFSLRSLLAGMADKSRHPEIKTGRPVSNKFGSAEWDKPVRGFTRIAEDQRLPLDYGNDQRLAELLRQRR
jgi:hypothetical protein